MNKAQVLYFLTFGTSNNKLIHSSVRLRRSFVRLQEAICPSALIRPEKQRKFESDFDSFIFQMSGKKTIKDTGKRSVLFPVGVASVQCVICVNKRHRHVDTSKLKTTDAHRSSIERRKKLRAESSDTSFSASFTKLYASLHLWEAHTLGHQW